MKVSGIRSAPRRYTGEPPKRDDEKRRPEGRPS
jgi:hypothetical protein